MGGSGQKERAPRARAHNRSDAWGARYVLEVSIRTQRAARQAQNEPAHVKRTTNDYSKGMAPSLPSLPSANALRLALLAAAAAGVICLLLATFATVIEINVGTTTKVPGHDTHLSGWDRHGPALLLIALFAAAMIAGALRGARPAMAAIAALGLVALLIALVGDVPDLNQTGFIGEVYEDAAAGPKAGFYLETLGAVLLLVSGGLMLALPAASAPAPRARGRERSADVA